MGLHVEDKPQKNWEILICWKDGSTTWEKLKYIKACYPIHLMEYAVQSQISKQPAFAWWIPHVIKKREQII